MGLWERLIGTIDAVDGGSMASRPSPNAVDGRIWGDEIWLGSSNSAESAEAAARVSAVYYCVSIIAETVGSLPLDIFEGDQPAEDFEMANILAYAPNPLQTGAEFWSSMAFRAALGGYAFAEPVVDQLGAVEVWPLDPAKQSIEWGERAFKLTYTGDDGKQKVFGPSELFWFSGLADGKIKPLTPWRMAKGSIDFAMALENQGREFFQKGSKLAGVLSSEQTLSVDVIQRLRESINRWRNGQTPVLESGLKYQAVAATNVDSQMVELIKQRTLEMARYWRIPKSMIGEDGGTAASQEQQALEFVKYTIRPWVRRIEQAITQRLFTEEQRGKYKAKFNLDGLLRGDSSTQVKNAMIIRNMSAGSVNDVRTRILGWPRIDEEWADDPREAMNSNRAADTQTGGETSPQDKLES